MTGKLIKKSEGWYVVKDWLEYPLHPEDSSENLSDGKEIEFYTVLECPHYNGSHMGKDCSCKSGLIDYAKIKSEKLGLRRITLEELSLMFSRLAIDVLENPEKYKDGGGIDEFFEQENKRRNLKLK